MLGRWRWWLAVALAAPASRRPHLAVVEGLRLLLSVSPMAGRCVIRAERASSGLWAARGSGSQPTRGGFLAFGDALGEGRVAGPRWWCRRSGAGVGGVFDMGRRW